MFTLEKANKVISETTLNGYCDIVEKGYLPFTLVSKEKFIQDLKNLDKMGRIRNFDTFKSNFYLQDDEIIIGMNSAKELFESMNKKWD